MKASTCARHAVFLLLIDLVVSWNGVSIVAAQQPPSAAAVQSAQNSLEYLRRVMDEFHSTIPVYWDVSSPGNRFHSWAKIPGANAEVDMNGSWTDNPYAGATAIRCRFMPTPGGPPFGGFYLMNGTLQDDQASPQPNFGTVPNAGLDLTGVTALTFYVRGKLGGEQIEFFVGGVGYDGGTNQQLAPYPDSSTRYPALGTVTTLTTTWQKVTISLTGRNLSYALGGFAWSATKQRNSTGAEFFLDQIQFELTDTRRAQRLNEPRFLRSLTTLPLQPDPFDGIKDGDLDFVLRNTAFSYDNALAIQAFLADGGADSLRRARLIGDAFVYALGHDRAYNDNRACSESFNPLGIDGARVRTAYAAGDHKLWPGWAPKGRVGTVPVPGFYDDTTQTFFEVEGQAVDTGNNLWVLIALAALHQRTGEASYLGAACKIGNFVHAQRNDNGAFRGFTGGIDAPEATTPTRRMWASSEHNIDAFAGFSVLYTITGEARWQQDAAHAAQFVEAMWAAGPNCYLAGTTDPNTRNTSPNTLPADVQSWSILALPAGVANPLAIACLELNHLNTSDGITGMDFNNDRDGVWPEGSGQAAVAAARAGRSDLAELLRAQLRFAQQTAPFGDGFGIVAASHDALSTGFLTAAGDPFKYFRRLHVGAVAWNVFAQLDVNPYYLGTLLPDLDQLPSSWEEQFGLNPNSAAGADGDIGDPDGDGLTNLQEFQAGTHPRSFVTRYLAEGATGPFFQTQLALLNPGPTAAAVLLRFQKQDGTTVSHVINVPAATRRTVAVESLDGLSSANFATVIESDHLVVIDRTMTWDARGFGSHAETALLAPSTTWLLAEGSTSGDFALFYLLLNPNDAAVIATVRYLRPFGLSPIVKTYTLPPRSRTTIPVDGEDLDLVSTDVSGVVTAPAPIIVERAMYRSTPAETFGAGHASAGVIAPATRWFLAEGATGPFFDLFILLANATDATAAVRVDYLLSTGETLTKTYPVPANGRMTIAVDGEEIPDGSGTRPLTNVAVSATVTSTNDVPIVVERTMWWPSPEMAADYWTETHNSPGTTMTAARWAVANGELGGPSSAETFLLIANTSPVSGQARVTLAFEDGTSAERIFNLLPRSRTTVNVSADVPEAAGKRFGAIIESLGTSPVALVVECAMYTSPNGRTWAAGTNSLGTALP